MSNLSSTRFAQLEVVEGKVVELHARYAQAAVSNISPIHLTSFQARSEGIENVFT